MIYSIGSDYLKNKPLEILKTVYNSPDQYFELLSGVGRKDHVSTISALENICTKIELDPTNYKDNLFDTRLKELWDEAQSQLNTWESFVMINKM